jgi:hypothetical protein
LFLLGAFLTLAIPLRAARSKSRHAVQRDDVSDVSGKNQLLDNGILSASEANLVRENELSISLSLFLSRVLKYTKHHLTVRECLWYILWHQHAISTGLQYGD